VGDQRHDPAVLSTGMTRYPLQEAGWAPGPVWTGMENLASPRIELQIVHPMASCEIDYATLALFFVNITVKKRDRNDRFHNVCEWKKKRWWNATIAVS